MVNTIVIYYKTSIKAYLKYYAWDIRHDGIRSETFYAAYVSGEEPEDDSWVLDFGEWASVYRTLLARHAEYRNIVQQMQHNTHSLAGLIRVAV